MASEDYSTCSTTDFEDLCCLLRSDFENLGHRYTFPIAVPSYQQEEVGFPNFHDYSSSNYISSEGMSLPYDLHHPGGWQMPWGVITMDNGSLFATDGRQLSKFNQYGEFVSDAVLHGGEKSCLPTGLCKAASNKLLISDAANSCILEYDYRNCRTTGQFGKEFLSEPYDVTVLPNGMTYVVDWSSHDLKLFDRNGRYVGTIGSRGNLRGEFEFPWSIASDSHQRLIVADNGNQRIQILDPDGRPVKQITGSEGSNLESPRGVDVDQDDNIYICCNGSIQIFSADGVFIRKIKRVKHHPIHPFGISVQTSGYDTYNYVMVSDRLLNTVRMLVL